MGRSVLDFIVAEDRARALSQIAVRREGPATGPTEYHGQHVDGSGFDIEVKSESIRDAEGSPTGMVVKPPMGLSQTIVFQPPPAAGAPPGAPVRLCGVLVRGERVYRLEAPATVLGRSRQCDVVINDPNVSRRHAEVRREGDGYVLVDLGSTNGLTVNGQEVKRAALADGDQVQLGTTALRFERRQRSSFALETNRAVARGRAVHSHLWASGSDDFREYKTAPADFGRACTVVRSLIHLLPRQGLSATEGSAETGRPW